jgi:integrase/recombinase XerD
MEKLKVTLSPMFHREARQVRIDFQRDAMIMKRLRQLPGLRWSKSNVCWYVPETQDIVSHIYKMLQPEAIVDYSGMPAVNGAIVLNHQRHAKVIQVGLPVLQESHAKAARSFEDWMRARRYSDNTVSTYGDALRIFLRYFHGHDLVDISNEDLVEFNNQYILAKKLSSSYQNQVINAVKLFFRTMESKKMSPELIYRPKRARPLPNVLSKEEVKEILQSQRNIKHRSMLSLIYSCGLRRSELLALKLNDVDHLRHLLIIRRAKGKKDRIAPLSLKMEHLLREYYAAYKPTEWVFEGQRSGEPYNERSLGHVLKQAVQKAGIQKPVTLHWLRHSYATHLLEAGTDLRYIQEILGHSRSTTTEIYTHVSTHNIQRVISPFENL